MEWTDECRHGIGWQDEQHRQLFDKIEELMQSVLIGGDRETFESTIKFLDGYSKEHFAREEHFMTKHGYPRKENHIREHQKFSNDINEISRQASYNGIESSAELLNNLTEWFFNHTQTTDKFLAKFLIQYEEE